MSSTLTFGEQ